MLTGTPVKKPAQFTETPVGMQTGERRYHDVKRMHNNYLLRSDRLVVAPADGADVECKFAGRLPRSATPGMTENQFEPQA